MKEMHEFKELKVNEVWTSYGELNKWKVIQNNIVNIINTSREKKN